jgi:hypothetical protein
VNADQARSIRRCAFCDGGPARAGYVLPAWLRELFPDETSAGEPFGARIALACRRCQRGWLSRLETEARPVLEVLISGRPFVLDRINQETLALWSAKTILTLQAARGPATFSRAVHRDVFERREPPTGFRLGLGIRAHEGEWPLRFGARSFRAGSGRPGLLPTFPGMAIDSYRAGLCVGHLVVRARASFAPQDADVLAEPAGVASLEIWPTRSPARWPPPGALLRMGAFDSAFENEPALAQRAA